MDAPCEFQNGFYTHPGCCRYQRVNPNAALKLHEQIETILDLIGALELENFKLRLPVTDQTSVIIWVTL